MFSTDTDQNGVYDILPKSGTSNDDAVYSHQAFAPADFPLSFSYRIDDNVIDGGWNSGLFDASQLNAGHGGGGTEGDHGFDGNRNAGGARYRMGNSWGGDFQANTLYYANAAQTSSFAGGTSLKARRSSAEHLIATKALRCTATAWNLIVAQCSDPVTGESHPVGRGDGRHSYLHGV